MIEVDDYLGVFYFWFFYNYKLSFDILIVNMVIIVLKWGFKLVTSLLGLVAFVFKCFGSLVLGWIIVFLGLYFVFFIRVEWLKNSIIKVK